MKNFSCSLFYRIISSFLFSFFFTLFSTLYFIKIAKKFKIIQYIKINSPQSHLYKNNTPTMGGITIIISIILTIIIFSKLYNFYTYYIIFILISYGIIGFIDDYFKIFNKKNIKGLTIKCKYFLQSIVTIILIIVMLINERNNLHMYFNIENINIIKYIIFFVLTYFVIISSSNSVNLTDGLDGLALIVIISICFGLSIFSIIQSNIFLSSYFKMQYIQNNIDLIIICYAIIGSSLGFLWFNAYPAQIFMGDVGSLSLGSVIGLITVLLHQELILIIMGGILVIETLSVIVQVFYFKFKHKKIFLMTPIHHHYELKGHKETKIVMRLWIISLILLFISLYIVLN